MGRAITRQEVIAALRTRYDHASARTVLDEALRVAELPAAPDGGWEPAAISKLVWTLHCMGDRAQPAATALMTLVSVASAPVTDDDEELDEFGNPVDEIAVADAELPGLIQQVVEAAVASVRERHRRGSTLAADEEPS